MGCCLSKEKHIDYVPLAHNQHGLNKISEVTEEIDTDTDSEPIHV